MRKNFLKILIFVISFFIFQTITKAEVICQYGNYKLVFEGNEFSELYIGEKLGKSANVYFDAAIEEDCPKEAYVYVYSEAGKDSYYFSQTNKFDGSSLIKLSSSFDEKLTCGNVNGIPKIIPRLTSLAITIVQIAVPIILVIMGSLDLFKGITAGKEDEMKKGQQLFVKRLVVGAIIFFVVVIVKFLVSVVADTNVNNIGDCIECFVSNDC